jgi:succinate dehydrogenase / fumarate reductase cytochrome b subunit
MHVYKTPIVGVAEIGLVGAILFHGFNGIRVVLIDYWRKGAKYQNQMFWVVIGIFVILMAAWIPRQLMHTFGE